MKKKMIAKQIALILSITLLIQAFAALGNNNWNMTAEAANSQDTIVYGDGFDYQPSIQSLLATDEWGVEKTYQAPKLSDGVVKMDIDDSIQFNWTQLDGIGDYDSTKTYTFEFDVKVTDWVNRTLYVAPGGYWNQVVLPNTANTGEIRAGGAYETYEIDELENQKLHVELSWLGNRITSTVSKGDTVLATGYREDDRFMDMTFNNNTMTFLVLRCETGSVEIDNFSFTDGTTTYNQDFDTPYFLNTDQWDLETDQYPGCKPNVSNGVMTLSTRDAVQFNWTKVDGVGAGAYDGAAKYIFEFDATIKNPGSTERVLYAAPGGYYNQVEINSSQIKLGNNDAGNSILTYDGSLTGKKIHIRVEWQGKTIETFLEQDGNVILTGKRVKDPYASTSDSYMKTFVMRCEEGQIEIDNFSFTDGNITYTEDFDVCGLNPMDTMLNQENDVWNIGDGKTDAKAPLVENGIVKMYSYTSLEFNWKNVPGIGEYDPTTTYTFEFDATPRHLGKAWTWSGNEFHTRVLYVANNEYYTQVDIYDSTPNLKVANNKTAAWSSSYKNNPLHVKLEWTGTTVTSTISDANGNEIVSSNREITVDYNMNDITLRCEDGAVDITNFRFSSVEKKVEYEYVSDISQYRVGTKSYPTREGYVFAGWWQGEATDVITDDADLTPIAETTVDGGAWAKYVPAEAFTVKAQTSADIASNPESVKLRLVSTIDSLRYQEVGFKVKFNGGNREYTYDMDTVFTEITALEEGDKVFNYAPTVFAPVSEFFVTYSFTGIGPSVYNSDYNFDVTPYWITLDGTTVTGVQRADLKFSDQFKY